MNLVAVEGELYVQYWLKPGDQAVALGIEEVPAREVVPAGLRGYL